MKGFHFNKAAGRRMQHHMVRAYSNNGSEKGRISWSIKPGVPRSHSVYEIFVVSFGSI